MGYDTDIVTILEDLVKFLELLSDVKLPDDLQNVHENLLRRSRLSLVVVNQRSTTPEPYLDMNAGKGRGLQLTKTININNVNQITEYMYADNSTQSRLSSCQDYYEPFLTNVSITPNSNGLKYETNDAEDELKSIYQTFSAEQTMSKAIKSSVLNLKEERRLFGFQIFSGFDQFRSCFIGLVGTHLLLYATKHDKHPSDIISIRGYSARPSPSAVSRDLERSKSAFEIFSPGNRTFQFIARSAKEMEQWVAVICRAGDAHITSVVNHHESSNTKSIIGEMKVKSIVSDNFMCSEEQYQDVSCINNEKQCENENKVDIDMHSDNENEVMSRNNEKFTTTPFKSTNHLVNPPPLPARIPPRRLPSLPQEHSSKNFDMIDDGYDEDDIYHKIEDVKQPTSTYQNISTANHILNLKVDRKELKQEKKRKNKSKNDKEKGSLSSIEIYDDAQPAEISKINEMQNEKTSMRYDDIQVNINDGRKEIVKETRKKSFLDRVRYKKESPKKEDTKKQLKQNKLNLSREIIQYPCSTSQESLPYDDAMGLAIEIKQNNHEDMGDYTSPPPPRAIYGKPPTIIISDVQDKNEEFYDDIGILQENRDEQSSQNPSSVTTIESLQLMNHENSSQLVINLPQTTTTATTSATTNTTSTTTSTFTTITTNDENDCEHYQVPRPQDPVDIKGQVEVATTPITEELYDDIAIVANFRARQRDSTCSYSSSMDKIQNSTTNVVKVWNRFASGRKLKTNDALVMEKNKKFNSDECSENTGFHANEEMDDLKMNKFQRLINKMESSLSKTKPLPSMINKSHDDNIN